jgi:hypothetical protein
LIYNDAQEHAMQFVSAECAIRKDRMTLGFDFEALNIQPLQNNPESSVTVLGSNGEMTGVDYDVSMRMFRAKMNFDYDIIRQGNLGRLSLGAFAGFYNTQRTFQYDTFTMTPVNTTSPQAEQIQETLGVGEFNEVREEGFCGLRVKWELPDGIYKPKGQPQQRQKNREPKKRKGDDNHFNETKSEHNKGIPFIKNIFGRGRGAK